MGPSEISHHVTPVDLQKTMRKEQIVEYFPRLSDMGYCCEKSKKTNSKMVWAVSFAIASYPGCVEGLGTRLPLQIRPSWLSVALVLITKYQPCGIEEQLFNHSNISNFSMDKFLEILYLPYVYITGMRPAHTGKPDMVLCSCGLCRVLHSVGYYVSIVLYLI